MRTTDRNAFSPREFCQRNGIGLTHFYSEIGAGRLTARKCGGRTLVTLEDEQAWLAAMPKLGQPQAA